MAAAAAAGAGGGGSREGTAKASVSDQISQAIQSTSNLLQLMQQSSPSQNLLTKVPKNLLAKTSTIKNTGVPHLKMVIQPLSNMDSCQLNYASHTSQILQESELTNNTSEELGES